MQLKERKVLDKCEVLRGGHIQVREANEIFDADIKPTPAIIEDGIVITPAVTDVKSSNFHRYVVMCEQETPADVQAFLDATKAP